MDNWTRYYKLDENGLPCTAQMAYEPLLNPERNVLCMNFDPYNSYQDYTNKIGFIPKIVFDFFSMEVKYLEKFKKYSWAPEVLDISNNKIFIKWNDVTCNDIINSKGELPTGWQDQLGNLIKDQLAEKVYKLSLYPHCHYIDTHGQLRAFDCYMSFDFDDCVIAYERVDGLIHKETKHRINEALIDDSVNMKHFFVRALEEHVIWPGNYLNKFYQEVKHELE